MITPETESTRLLAVTRSKSKMYEYHVPENSHIAVTPAIKNLISLTIGILGDQYDLEPYPQQKSHLLFSATYFDALNGSRMLSDDSSYLKFLGAISYYLGGFPGSTHVLLKNLENLNLDSSGIERVILAILRKEPIKFEGIEDGLILIKIREINNHLTSFLSTGNDVQLLKTSCLELQELAFNSGNDRELFLAGLLNEVLDKYLKRRIV